MSTIYIIRMINMFAESLLLCMHILEGPLNLVTLDLAVLILIVCFFQDAHKLLVANAIRYKNRLS